MTDFPSFAEEVDIISSEKIGKGSADVVTEEEVVETVPAPPVVQIPTMGSSAPNLPKQARKVENAYDAVVAKIAQRRKELASDLKRFEGGVENILRLISVTNRRKRGAKEGRKTDTILDNDNLEDEYEGDDEYDVDRKAGDIKLLPLRKKRQHIREDREPSFIFDDDDVNEDDEDDDNESVYDNDQDVE